VKEQRIKAFFAEKADISSAGSRMGLEEVSLPDLG
jgi:hypothetical protein